MTTIDLSTARMIGMTALCEILNITRPTFYANPENYRPATRLVPNGRLQFFNLDVQAWLLTGGRIKTHLEFAREQRALERAERKAEAESKA